MASNEFRTSISRGGIGSLLRYGIAVLLNSSGANFPLPTFIANIMASVLLGFFLGVHGLTPLSDQQRLFFMTGICGGFSTFSTFSAETVELIQSGHTPMALFYVLGSIFLATTGILLGVWIGWCHRQIELQIVRYIACTRIINGYLQTTFAMENSHHGSWQYIAFGDYRLFELFGK